MPKSIEIPVRLSKSRIVEGLACHKRAHMSVHSKELRAPIDQSTQTKFDTGNEIGARARKEFPGGHLVDFPPYKITEAQADTQKAIDSGINTIYEAAFGNDEAHCFVDILHRESADDDWSVYEVKSGTKDKPEYIEDLAIQCWILDEVGIKWDTASLIFLNKNCFYPDLSNLFTTKDLTDKVTGIIGNGLPAEIKKISEMVSKKATPGTQLGQKCVKPYDCPYKAHCWKDVSDYTVLDVPLGWNLFKKTGSLEVSSVDEKKHLTATQKLPFKVLMEEYTHIDKKGIASMIKPWNFPIYHLDFETINPAIPRYEGTSPYEQIPFQFSVHVQTDLESEPESFEFLHHDTSDPRCALAEKLCESIPETAEIVLAYSAHFEKRVLKQLASICPDLSEQLLAIAEKLVDLLPVVKKNVCHKEFRGSFSIKAVAPVLLGEDWNYSRLTVKDGLMAQEAFDEMVADGTSAKDADLLRTYMLQYCAQDTLAMVELVKWLYSN